MRSAHHRFLRSFVSNSNSYIFVTLSPIINSESSHNWFAWVSHCEQNASRAFFFLVPFSNQFFVLAFHHKFHVKSGKPVRSISPQNHRAYCCGESGSSWYFQFPRNKSFYFGGHGNRLTQSEYGVAFAVEPQWRFIAASSETGGRTSAGGGCSSVACVQK